MKVCFVQVSNGETNECNAILIDTIQIDLRNADGAKGECYSFSEQHTPFNYGWFKNQLLSEPEEYKDLLAHLKTIYDEIEVVYYFKIEGSWPPKIVTYKEK